MLLPLSSDSILSFLNENHAKSIIDGNGYIIPTHMILLVDGKVLPFSKYRISIIIAEINELQYTLIRKHENEYRVAKIPFNVIAGFFECFPYSSNEGEGRVNYIGSFVKDAQLIAENKGYLARDLIQQQIQASDQQQMQQQQGSEPYQEQRQAQQMPISGHFVSIYSQPQTYIKQKAEYVLGDFKFTTFTPLYCDWDFFLKRMGGVNSIGIGVAIASFTLGWQPSPYAEFKKCFKQKALSLPVLYFEGETVIEGYAEQIVGDSWSMEGKKWSQLLLTSKRVSKDTNLDETPWILGWICEDSIMYPAHLWERISSPIRVYGELLGIEMQTDFGHTKSVLKIRAVAFVAEPGNEGGL